MIWNALKKEDTPGVVAPPPLIFLAGLLSGAGLDWLRELPVAAAPILSYARFAGAALVASGLFIVLAAKRSMSRAATSIEPWKPTTAIVSDGVFSLSRNPVYAALTVIYLGLTLIINSWWPVAFLAAVAVVMHYGVIAREERYLEGKFGDAYLDYKRKVRRWI